ncbi:hypothetical protein TNCV_1457021 [Trichonephila clavipes]|nr:hypothetical protein TNCV_1457021 [Trichonephila clavipes]
MNVKSVEAQSSRWLLGDQYHSSVLLLLILERSDIRQISSRRLLTVKKIYNNKRIEGVPLESPLQPKMGSSEAECVDPHCILWNATNNFSSQLSNMVFMWYWARTRDKASHDPIPITLGYRGHGNPVVKVTPSWLACHKFEPSTAEDPPRVEEAAAR